MYYEPPFKLNDNILQACRKGICRVGVMYDTEGTAVSQNCIDWLESFAELNGLDSSNFFFSHGDRKLKLNYPMVSLERFKPCLQLCFI